MGKFHLIMNSERSGDPLPIQGLLHTHENLRQHYEISNNAQNMHTEALNEHSEIHLCLDATHSDGS